MIDQAAFEDLRFHVRRLCATFPNSYWQTVDAERAYPEEFVQAMTVIWRRSFPRRMAAAAAA